MNQSLSRSGERPVLSAEGLVKAYGGRTVVSQVSLDVSGGEIVGLLGPNGAGKTTTFCIVVGLVRPDAGVVRLGDDDLTELPMYLRARAGISYLPQEPSVFRKMTVEENLLAILETLDLSAAERASAATPCSRSSAWRSCGATAPTRCRAASAGGSRSPGAWSCRPISSSWTSRSRASTRSPCSISSKSCGAWPLPGSAS